MGFGDLWVQKFPPKAKWGVKDIPDLEGQVAIVTGGNSGVGYETCKALLEKNAKVYMATRNKERAEAAIAELKKATGKEAIFLQLDLASLKEVKKSALEFQSKESHLHMLYNSGGVMAVPIDQVTKDGYDMQFGVNTLGHFYFTQLLLPTLIETAKVSKDGKVRVVTTSSYGHVFVSKMAPETYKDGPERKKYGNKLYGQSKFGNILIANELARRYGSQGIVSTSCHPGSLKTNLQQHIPHKTFLKVWSLTLYHPSFGALTQLRAGTAPEGAEWNGKYLIPWARLGEPHPGTKDEAEAKKLWEYCEEQVKNV